MRQLSRDKKAAWKAYKRFGRVEDKLLFKVLAKQMRAKLEVYCREREEKILRSASIKTFYAYSKGKIRPLCSMAPIRDASGSIHFFNTDKANTLNDFFHIVFTQDDGNLPNFDKSTDQTMPLQIFEVSDVRHALSSTKNSNSPGPDGCPPCFLKLFPELCFPLTDLYNLFMQQCSVPLSWKEANIIPIYKGKGSKMDVANYRPISLTNVFCKNIEKLVCDKLLMFLDQNNLFSTAQAGFRPGHSTLSQLPRNKSLLLDSFNNRQCTDAVYTDMSKAFDSISHKKLLYKLAAYGVHDNVCKWIESFLSSRRQRVLVNGCVSEWKPCTSGVPQGSVLGPLLFLIYINDLPDHIHHSSILLYADDAKLLKYISNRLDCTLFQQNINSLSRWCSTWQIHLNIAKCVSIRFGLVDSIHFTSEISETPLVHAHSSKDLGVIFDGKLNFSDHCNSVANRVMAHTNVLLKCFHSRDYQFQVKLFNAYV